MPRVTLGVDAENPTGATHLYERVGMHVESENVVFEKALDVSHLRAKCPTCRAYTAVAIGPDYECHSCGRTFAAGLVRVPRAWGDGGEPMVEAASLAARLSRSRRRSKRTRSRRRRSRWPPTCRAPARARRLLLLARRRRRGPQLRATSGSASSGSTRTAT